jgi:uncharacterized protein (TIGR03083 family)
MQTTAMIDALEREGIRLADAASRISLDARIPTCPDWSLRDLVRHVGGVHHWAAGHIRQPTDRIAGVADLRELLGEWPDDHELIDWYRAELSSLVGALRAAPSDLQTATFLAHDGPLSFWARRQMHEATIHRIDVQLAGGSNDPVPASQAADGIDEMLTGFAVRRHVKFRSPEPRHIVIAPDDSEIRWTLSITDQPLVVDRQVASDADTTVRGLSDVIFRVLWNRLPATAAPIEGDAGLIDRFKEAVQIRWN